MAVNVTLPIPPTVNHMYRPGTHLDRGKRYKTKDYRLWEKAAGGLLLPQKAHFRSMEEPPYEYDVTFYFGNKRRQDADNRLKALQDVVASVYQFDDSLITDGAFHKRVDADNPRCELSIWGNG